MLNVLIVHSFIFLIFLEFWGGLNPSPTVSLKLYEVEHENMSQSQGLLVIIPKPVPAAKHPPPTGKREIKLFFFKHSLGLGVDG